MDEEESAENLQEIIDSCPDCKLAQSFTYKTCTVHAPECRVMIPFPFD